MYFDNLCSTHLIGNPHYADHDMSLFFNDFKHNIFQQRPNELNDKDQYMVYLQKEFVLYDNDDQSNDNCDPKVMFQISTNLGIEEDNISYHIKQDPELSKGKEDIESIFSSLKEIEKESEMIYEMGLSTYVFRMMNLERMNQATPWANQEDGNQIKSSPIKVKRKNLPKEATSILMNWLKKNVDNPYPSEIEKENLRLQTNLTIGQINNWFTNARSRKWKQLKARKRRFGKV